MQSAAFVGECCSLLRFMGQQFPARTRSSSAVPLLTGYTRAFASNFSVPSNESKLFLHSFRLARLHIALGPSISTACLHCWYDETSYLGPHDPLGPGNSISLILFGPPIFRLSKIGVRWIGR